jgi:hypothetical protein
MADRVTALRFIEVATPLGPLTIVAGPPVLVLVLLVACGAGAGTTPTTAPSGPSGSLGVVTAQAAGEAVTAICGLERAPDRDTANGLFYDHAHATLHAIAAATEPVDRVPAARVLQTMQVVEADLQADVLPDRFADDAAALLRAVRGALHAVDLPAPDC